MEEPWQWAGRAASGGAGWGEEVAQGGALAGIVVEAAVEVGEFLFHGADGPASGGGEVEEVDGGSVEGADVAGFVAGGVVLFFEPAQGEPLGAADIGAPGVDAAVSLVVEHGAGAGWVGRRGEDGSGVGADEGGLGWADAEVVDAAGGAAGATLEVEGLGEGGGVAVDLLVEVFEDVEELGWGEGGHGRSRVGQTSRWVPTGGRCFYFADLAVARKSWVAVGWCLGGETGEAGGLIAG